MSDTALPDGLMTLFKTGARALVLACAAPGQTGPQRVESITGFSQGQISKWGSENDPALMPLHVVGILEAASGKPIMTRMLATLTGHRLEALAEGGDAQVDLMTDIVRITGSHARFQSTAADALEDQKLTPGEVKELIKSGMAHMDQMSALLRRLAPLAGA
ncbi:hypothetical protein [Bosea sp. BK604]|uniref:hypothetical protein n=1 Tax=Bosea sp. BK604 TaxID=2512180 RepID=UPI001047DEBB|nr:hypothetical protein [Bosea sp. BK604]TCR69714.1 hypothetical protein EV560_101111 [Bosea sp. BK604]